MAFFRHSWQFLQLAQLVQFVELVAVVFVDQLGELVRLLGLLVADNRAHALVSFPASLAGQRQTTHLQQHQAIDQGLARSGCTNCFALCAGGGSAAPACRDGGSQSGGVRVLFLIRRISNPTVAHSSKSQKNHYTKAKHAINLGLIFMATQSM